MYEYFTQRKALKLFFDIDIKYPEIPTTYTGKKEAYLDEIIDKSIKLINKQLRKHKIKNTPIMILKSNRQDKLSSHIIYPEVFFEGIPQMKDWIEKLIKNQKMDTIDMSVYRDGSLRMLWNSKMDYGVTLEYDRGINYTYKDDKTLFMDSLITCCNTSSKEGKFIKMDLVEIAIKKIEEKG